MERVAIRDENGIVRWARSQEEVDNYETLGDIKTDNDLYNKKLEETRLTEQEEQAIIDQANADPIKKTKSTLDYKEDKSRFFSSPKRIYDEESYDSYVFDDFLKQTKGDKDEAKALWISAERTKKLKDRQEAIFEELEDDIQPWYVDLGKFAAKSIPGGSVIEEQLDAPYKAARLKLEAQFTEKQKQKEIEVTNKVGVIKKRKNHIEHINAQIEQIEHAAKADPTSVTLDIQSQYQALIDEYRASVEIFQTDLEELENVSIAAQDFGQIADLAKRTYNELDVFNNRIKGSITRMASGALTLYNELSYTGLAQNVFGIDLMNPEDLKMVPEVLRSHAIMKGVEYNQIKMGAKEISDITENINQHTRYRQELGEMRGIGDFGDFMLDLMSEQLVNTAITVGTGGAGLAIIAGSAAGNKMEEMNITIDGIKAEDGSWLVKPQKINAAQYYAAGIGYGLAEYITERVSLGQAKMGLRALGFQKKAFGKAIALTGKHSLKTMTFGKAALRYGINVNQEGGAEFFAQLGQNAIDKWVLNNDDIDLLDGVGTAYISGALMSGFGFQAPVVAKDVYQAYIDKKGWGKINKNTGEIIRLNQEIKKLEKQDKTPTRDKAIKELQLQADVLMIENLKAKGEAESKMTSMSKIDKRNAMDLMARIRKNKIAVDNLNANDKLSTKAKETAIAKRMSEINRLENQHDNIIAKANGSNDRRLASKLVMEDAILKGKNIKIAKGDGNKDLRESAFKIIDESNLTPEQKKAYKAQIEKNAPDGSDAHGFAMDLFGEYIMFQNEANAFKGDDAGGNYTVYSHELSHQTLFNMIAAKGGDMTEMANMLETYVKNRYSKMWGVFKKVDKGYATFNEAKRGEEKMAAIIDFIRKYHVKGDRTIQGKLLDGWNNLLGKTKTQDQVNEIRTGEDVWLMLNSYADSFEAGEMSGLAAKVIKGEVGLNKATQKIQDQQRKEGTSYSGPEAMYDRTEKALGIKKDADGNVTWPGFNMQDAQIAGWQWKNEVEKRIRKYQNFSDYNTYKDDIVSGVTVDDMKGARGIVDIIRRWDPAVTPDIARWINGQLDAKIDGVRKKFGVGLEFKRSMSDMTDAELNEFASENNFTESSNTNKLDTKEKVKIKLHNELKSDVANEINSDVKSMFSTTNIQDKTFKTLVDATPAKTQEMFGIKPKPGNLTRNDIGNAQEFIVDNADVLIAMLPDGTTVSGTSTGVQEVLLRKFYTKGDAVKYKETGSTTNLELQVKNPIPSPQFEVEMVKNENGELVESKIETPAYAKFKNEFLEYFGIVKDGDNLYKKETNVSARIKALVAQTGKMLTNQAVRESKLAKGESVNALKNVSDGVSDAMFSLNLRKIAHANQETAVGIINKLRSLELSSNDMDNLQAVLSGHLAEFLITQKQTDGIIKDLQDIWKKYSNFKPSLTANNLTATEVFFKEVEREAGLNPDSPINFKSINNYNGPTGTGIFNSKTEIENARSQIASLLKEGIITKAEAYRYFGGMALAAEIGDGRYIPLTNGSTLVQKNKNWDRYKYDIDASGKKVYRLKYKLDDKGKRIEGTGKKIARTNRYGLFQNRADLNAFIEIHGTKDGTGLGTASALTNTLHVKKDKGKPRLPTNAEIETAVENSKEDNKFLGTLADRLRKRYAEDKISMTQVAALVQTMNNNPGSLLRTAGIMDFVQEGLVAGEIDLEHMTPAKNIGLSMFQYITTIGDDTSGFKDKLDGYRTALISKDAHKTINKFYKDFMPAWWDGTMMSLVRYFNPLTMGKFNVKLKQLSTGGIIGPEIIKNKKAFKKAQANNLKVLKSTGVMMSKNLSNIEMIDKLKLVDKALELAKKKDKKRKGISVIDFDDTLAITDSKIHYKIPRRLPDGGFNPAVVGWGGISDTGSLTPAEFAQRHAELEAMGAEFDYSEFNEVKKGKKGPFFDKAKALKDKFGNNDIFILTARPQAADAAIQAFLKGIGLDIKIENIVGLEDGTPLAKADWIVQRAAEGYNDFLFADDQIRNVEAVKSVLDVIDVKSDVQQAMFSLNLSQDFNEMIEIKKGISAKAVYSAAMAKIKGAQTGQFTFYLPPSAEDFMGLMYNFIGKGKKGDQQLKWMNDKIMRPYDRGVQAVNLSRQNIQDDYRALTKQYPSVKRKLGKKIPNSLLTYDQAVRIYLWDKAGHTIPGLAKRDLASVKNMISKEPQVQLFAENLLGVTKSNEYLKPSDYWVVESIPSNLREITDVHGRKAFLTEFNDNIDVIFSKDNLNKVEAVYGTPMREAIEDSIYRMKNGTNRPSGSNAQVNNFMEWINNSVGATMFFNFRSATLQSISTLNFMNWSDNNPLMAAKAFANQPQYWSDFLTIFNSAKLKQRRGGLQLNVQEAELAQAANKGGPKGVLAYLLKIGFTPTRIVDSFAISAGGATMYRNRINTYIKQGYNKVEAKKRAWEDFSEVSEKTQQSADPALISQIQASSLGRVIFAWQNTPFQYNRLMKKAARDLINGRGDAKSHISKILYYGAVQNFAFNALQSALFALLPGMQGDEDEDEERQNEKDMKKKIRVANNMVDTILRGSGLPGAIVSTLKNMILKYQEQEKKGFLADHTYTIIEAVNLSPPLGSKIRKGYGAIQTYTRFEKDVIDARGFNLDSPIYSVGGNLIEAATNIPLARLVNITTNTYAALDARHQTWQRVAMAMGWNSWDVGVEPFPEHDLIKSEAKEKRKQEGIEKGKKTRAEFTKLKKQIIANMNNLTYQSYQKLTTKQKNAWIKKEVERLRKRNNE
ncbi:MAG TPA: hypothetical protein EYG07_00265 [Alphaproteobacteria bacterium]|nr:hypothetical protein [Alphaproteobacteria bacterium]